MGRGSSRRDRGAQLAALQHARGHAIASGDLRRQIDAWNEVGGAMLFGRTPVDEVLAFLDDELAWARERDIPAVEADALLGGPYLSRAWAGSMRVASGASGRRRSAASSGRLRAPEAHAAGRSWRCSRGGPTAAERELRDAIAVVESIGAERYAALYRSRLAHVLLETGMQAGAEEALEAARVLYGISPRWLSARARLLARQGSPDEAVRLAREAAAGTAVDDLTARARELTALAEVLRAQSDEAGAVAALEEAAALHDEKGNLVPAERCRALLGGIGAQPRL